MDKDELCEADKVLPDGNHDYHIDNCGDFDVFKCLKFGKMNLKCLTFDYK